MRYLSEESLQPLRQILRSYEQHLKDAKNDPSTEPYKSKYLAIGSLEEIQKQLTHLDENSEHGAAIQAGVLAAYGSLKSEVEELTQAEESLTRCLEICDKVQEDKFTILARISGLMQLGIIWCGRDQLRKAKDHLDKSIKVYHHFKQENNQDIFELKDLLDPVQYRKIDQEKLLESAITHSYYYLAQVEGKLGNASKSAELCHTTLDRQLLVVGEDRDLLDWKAWASNCAVLSQFYLNQDNFAAAWYHLAAALSVLDSFRPSLRQDGEEGEEEAIRKLEAEVYRYCAKYGLALLELSHCSRLNQQEGSSQREENQERPDQAWCTFNNLDVTNRVNDVTTKRLEDFEAAKSVFLWAQKRCADAALYYTLEDKCSDYVELIREQSQLFKHLIAFESDNDRKCKMHRRRADLLEPLRKELSPTYYLLTIRQLDFELGEIHSDLVDLKRERWTACPTNQHFARKVNLLVKQAIQHFQDFLDSMKIAGKDPDRYTEDNVRPALIARFYLGRLASKYVVGENTQDHLTNITLTFAQYKRIVDYCQQNPDCVHKVSEELEACREMVRLLPIKMEKIRRSVAA